MLTLITGGSKNGKSHIAESIITGGTGPRFYIATMEPFCEEALAAIERHRRIRADKGFETIEKYTDIQDVVLPKNSAVLLECACNLCANEMFSAKEADASGKIVKGIEKLLATASQFVIVTNQVGDDGIVYPKETMEYIRQMGLLNEYLAKRADRVIEAVYGIPVVLKGDMPSM